MSQTISQGAFRKLRRLAPYLRRYQRLLWLGLFCITVSNVCSTTMPRVVGATLDTLVAEQMESSQILRQIGAILALTAGSGFFMFATRQTIIVASRRIEEDLRNDFVAALRLQPQQFYHDRSTGSILAHASNDIAAVREFIGPAIMYSANTFTTFALAFTWMLQLNLLLTAVIVVPIPFIAFTTYRLGRSIHARYKDVQSQYDSVTTHAQETFSGVRVVRSYAREEHENKRFEALSRAYYSKNMRLARVNALMMPSMTVLFNISYVAVIGIGGSQVMTGALTVGNLLQFFIYLNQLIWPIAAIGWVTGMIQRGAASIGRLSTIMDAVPSIRDNDSTNHTLRQLAGDVTVHNVTLRFGERTVLDDVSFHARAGATIGIVGHVGSGKSSLVNLLPRLFDVSEGSVAIDGTDVRSIPLAVLRGAIAVVPQESFLFSDTIRENIRFGRPDASDDDVLRAARIAQLHDDVTSLRDGYDTVVGERGITLSGGQKQRTALARAILSNPRILILDDALSAVDTDTEDRILSELTSVFHGRTTFVIAHRISTVKRCTHILVLHNGRIVEQGTHDELVGFHGLYADIHERQILEKDLES